MRLVRIGVVIRELGLSIDTWRRAADSNHVRAGRLNGTTGARVFDLDSCRQYAERIIAGEVRNTQPSPSLRTRQQQFLAGRPK